MSQPINEATVRHIARLARVALRDDEIACFTAQMGGILEYVQQLSALDVSDVEPTAHPLPITDVLRDDLPHEPLGTDAALANAPRAEAGHFALPKVLEQQDA